MSKVEIAAKGTLFAVAISLITAGSKLIETDLYTGIAVLVVGIALVVIWAFLIDREARETAVNAVQEKMMELEGKRSCKRN